MVRADEFSLAQVIFVLGNVLLLFKFVTWKELHLNPIVQRLIIILFAAVTMSGLSVFEVRWIDGLRPVPPDILAMPDRPGSNTMVLLVSNHKTNIEGVRVKILEHTQRNRSYDPPATIRAAIHRQSAAVQGPRHGPALRCDSDWSDSTHIRPGRCFSG